MSEAKAFDINERIRWRSCVETEGTKQLNGKYKPDDLKIGQYFIPCDEGKKTENNICYREYGEIAARIIWQCQLSEKFAAINYRDIAGAIYNEMQENKRRVYEKQKQIPMSRFQKIKTAIQKVLGLEQTPSAETEEKQERPLPQSILTFHCRYKAEYLETEIEGMANEGYLKIIEQDGEIYLEPTEKLIQDVLALQNNKGL